MIKRITKQILMIAIGLLIIGSAVLSIPKYIVFQATISDTNEGLLNGYKNLQVYIYDNNNVLWTETHNGQQFIQGKVELLLGKQTDLTAAIMNKENLQLGIKIFLDSNTPKEVRLDLNTVFYSLVSSHANSVDWSNVSNKPQIGDERTSYYGELVSTSNSHFATHNGGVGIGKTTTINQALDVSGNAAISGSLYFGSTSLSEGAMAGIWNGTLGKLSNFALISSELVEAVGAFVFGTVNPHSNAGIQVVGKDVLIGPNSAYNDNKKSTSEDLFVAGNTVMSTGHVDTLIVSGNIGIGTSVPSGNNLHLFKRDLIVGSGDKARVHNLDNNNSSDVYIEGNLVVDGHVIQQSDSNINVYDDMQISSNVYLAVNDADASVGVGTNSPKSDSFNLVGKDMIIGTWTGDLDSLASFDTTTDEDIFLKGTLITQGGIRSKSGSNILKTLTVDENTYLAKVSGKVGIGTIDPTQLLHVSGNTLVSGNTIIGGSLRVTDDITIGNTSTINFLAGNKIGNGTLTGTWNILTNSDLIIGDTANKHDLSAKSDVYIEGNLVVDGKVVQSYKSLSIFEDIRVSGDSKLAINSGKVGIGRPFSNGITVEELLHVAGNTLITGNVRVSGDVLLESTSTINFNTHTIAAGEMTGTWNIKSNGDLIMGPKDKAHDMTTTSSDIYVNGNLVVDGESIQEKARFGELRVSRDSYLAMESQNVGIGILSGAREKLHVSGNVLISANATIGGTTDIGGDTSVSGALRVTNDITLGNTSTINFLAGNKIGNGNLIGTWNILTNSDLIIGLSSKKHNLSAKSDVYIEGNLVVDGKVVQTTELSSIYEDIQVSSNAYLSTRSGGVGIGRPFVDAGIAPIELLHVAGNALVTGNLRVSENVTVSSNINLGASINFTAADPANSISDGKVQGDWNYLNGALTNINKVGIGTTTAETDLHIYHATNAIGSMFKSDAESVTQNLISGGEKNVYTYYKDTDTNATIGLASGKDGLAIALGGDYSDVTNIKLFINESDGKVGLGTVLPSENLHVEGSALITGNLRVSDNLTVSNNISLGATINFTAADPANKIGDGKVVGDWDFTDGALTNIQKIGIGTATATKALDVYHKTAGVGSLFKSDAESVTQNLISGGDKNVYTYYEKSGTKSTIGIPSGKDGLAIALGGDYSDDSKIQVFINESDGNVGLGSLTPEVKLVVAGDTLVTGNLRVSKDITLSSTSTINFLTGNKIGNGTLVGTWNMLTNSDLIIGDTANKHDLSAKSDVYIEGNLVVDGKVVQTTELSSIFEDIQVSSNVYLAMNSGHVAIGTKDDADTNSDLHVYDSTDKTVVRIDSKLDKQAYTLFSANNNAKSAFVGIDDNVTGLVFGTKNGGGSDPDNDTKMVLDEDGKLGIGSTDPAATLDIYHATNAISSVFKSNSDTVTQTLESGADKDVYLKFDNSNLAKDYFIGLDEGKDALILGYDITTLGTDSEMYIQEDKVGIGTIPSARLHVKEKSTNDTELRIESHDDAYIKFMRTDNTGVINGYIGASAPSAKKGLAFAVGGTGALFSDVKLFISSESSTSGNIGIGTVDPTGMIHLYKSNEAYMVNENANTKMYSGIFENYDGYSIGSSTTTTGVRLFIQESDGNVGIGSLTPATKLDVNGDITIGSTKSIIHSGDTDTKLTFATDQVTLITGTTDAEQLTIKGSKVGIGTDDPNKELDVRGDIQIGEGKTIYQQNQTNTKMEFGTDLLKFYSNGTNVSIKKGNVGINVDDPAELLDINGNILISGSSKKLYMGDSGEIVHQKTGDTDTKVAFSSDKITVQTGGSDVTFKSGKVGIGSADPAQSLDVNGDIQMTQHLIHTDDTNTKLSFDTGTASLAAATSITLSSGGDITVKGGKLGIGSATPAQSLDVNGSIALEGTNAFALSNSRASSVTDFELPSAGSLYFGTTEGLKISNTRVSSVTNFELPSAGSLYFGTNKALELSKLYLDNTEIFEYTGGVLEIKVPVKFNNADVKDSNNEVVTSDMRLKTDIQDLSSTSALDKITKLRGVTYGWKNPELHVEGRQTGFLAQDIEEVFPHWVTEIEGQEKDKDLVDEDGLIKAIALKPDFNVYLIEAIKALKEENEALKKRLDALESKSN